MTEKQLDRRNRQLAGAVYKTMSHRKTDYQRSKVYAAEWALRGQVWYTTAKGDPRGAHNTEHLMTGRWIKTKEQAQALVDQVIEDHPDLLPKTIPWRTSSKQTRTAKAGMWRTPAKYRGMRQIRFPAYPFEGVRGHHLGEGFFNRELIHLHEIAHCFHHTWRDKHGPNFTGTLAYLVGKYIGAPAEEELRRQYAIRRVRVGDPPMQYTIDASEPVRVA